MLQPQSFIQRVFDYFLEVIYLIIFLIVSVSFGGLALIAETLIIWLNPVDALPSKDLSLVRLSVVAIHS